MLTKDDDDDDDDDKDEDEKEKKTRLTIFEIRHPRMSLFIHTRNT